MRRASRVAPAAESDFLAGRDLAVSLLRQAAASTNQSLFCIETEFRDGAVQDNIVLTYLRRVSADPRLAEGFAAVVSDVFFAGFTDADRYAELSFDDMRGASRRLPVADCEVSP